MEAPLTTFWLCSAGRRARSCAVPHSVRRPGTVVNRCGTRFFTSERSGADAVRDGLASTFLPVLREFERHPTFSHDRRYWARFNCRKERHPSTAVKAIARNEPSLPRQAPRRLER